MSLRKLLASTAGGLAIALGAMPITLLHAQGGDLTADSQFIRDVVSDNLLEVRLGQVAQKKSTSLLVKQFGQRMVTDHSKMVDQWTDMVSKSGTPYQPSLTDAQEQEVSRLDKTPGTEFDRTYMTAMIQAHQNAVTKFQTQGQSANSSQVRDLVNAGLPILQQHLTMARDLGSKVGATEVAVGAPTPPVANAPPQNAPAAPVGQLALRADSALIREVSAANLLEVRLGQIAQDKSKSLVVRQFGQRMVNDHNQLQGQWATMAQNNGIAFQPVLTTAQEQEVNRLGQASGAEFDRAYMTSMIQHHQNDVNRLQSARLSSNSPQVRQLVSSSLPILQQHLSMANQVGSQVGADTTFAGVAVSPATPTGNVAANRADLAADSLFIRRVVGESRLQISAGELAQKKARDAAVKRYAETVVNDHKRLQSQWSTIDGVTFRPSWGPLHQVKLDRLEGRSGRAFDRAYMKLMVQEHEGWMHYLQKEGRASKSARVRALVEEAIPIFQRDLRLARQVGRQVGADIAAANTR